MSYFVRFLILSISLVSNLQAEESKTCPCTDCKCTVEKGCGCCSGGECKCSEETAKAGSCHAQE